jgi:hypothetical protein
MAWGEIILKIYQFVLFASILVLLAGASLVGYTILSHPDSIIHWLPVIQLSAPAFILLGVFYFGNKLPQGAFKVLLLFLFMGFLIAIALRVMPIILAFPVFIALTGMYIGFTSRQVRIDL